MRKREKEKKRKREKEKKRKREKEKKRKKGTIKSEDSVSAIRSSLLFASSTKKNSPTRVEDIAFVGV